MKIVAIAGVSIWVALLALATAICPMAWVIVRRKQIRSQLPELEKDLAPFVEDHPFLLDPLRLGKASHAIPGSITLKFVWPGIVASLAVILSKPSGAEQVVLGLGMLASYIFCLVTAWIIIQRPRSTTEAGPTSESLSQ